MTASGEQAPPRLAAGITRDVLENDGLRDIMRQRHPDVALIDDASMRQSIVATLAARPPAADVVAGVWVFGYGSLLWNPCVSVAQWSVVRVHGYHRDFRIRLTHGRGSPDAPGLMLGLAPGGSCVGMGMRIDVDDLEHELLMIWRREMLTGVYRPRWVWLRGAGGPVPAMTFVTDPGSASYCARLDEAEKVRLLATGHGMLGSSAQYLNNTVKQLDAQGIYDRHMHVLHDRVERRLHGQSEL